MLLTLDDVAYTAKPDRAEFGRLMNRLKSAQPREVDKAQFCAHVAAGKSFIGGAFSDGLQTLQSWQLAALDFDNCGKRKQPLRPGEDGYISPIKALDRCETLGLSPLALYFTISSTVDNPRFRLVFLLEEPITDESRAHECIELLMGCFPECDGSCGNANRLFLGSCGEVWAVYEVWFV